MTGQNEPSGSFTAWDNTMCNPLAPVREQCQNAWHDGYASAKQEWQNLTDDEIKEIVGPWGDTPIKGYTRKLFDQIEAKLKEKNT